MKLLGKKQSTPFSLIHVTSLLILSNSHCYQIQIDTHILIYIQLSLCTS
jgi:hypothetical protein